MSKAAPPDTPVEVFAVEDRAVQIAWAWLPSSDMTIEIGDQRLEVGIAPPAWYREARGGRPVRVQGGQPLPARAGPGAVTVGGLEPSTTYDVCLKGPGTPRTKVASATTLPKPPGRLLARFASISDCHIGERRLGLFNSLHDPRPRPRGMVPYPTRCARAAISEAESWGAELLVAKGDLTQKGTADELYAVIDIFRSAAIPVEAILGNHDIRGPLKAAEVMSSCGFPVSREPRARDLPGARLVFGHSPVPDLHVGAVSAPDAAAMARLARDTDGPVVVVMHHPPQRWLVETHYPPSISWPDSTRLVSGLVAANPATLIIAGHTHRNRRYPVGGLTVAEVGSTKDYPGQWAGYSVYEGGIRQVVFRVAEPSAIAWTESTRRVLGGIWGWWSPGRLSDRCWTLEWPNRVVAAS